MNHQIRIGLFGITLAGALAMTSPGALAQERFVTIGTGGQTGVYYVVGQSICRLVNRETSEHGLRCTAPSTGGSVANVNAIVGGAAESGFVQADVAFWAHSGTGVYEGKPKVEDLRGIANLYPETIHLVARKGAGIKSPADLKGKRVSLDEPGSGTLIDARIVLAAYGLTEKDIKAEYLKPNASGDRLRDGALDAFFFVGGYPTGAISELATSSGIELVPIAGPEAKKILADYKFFGPDKVPAGTYKDVDAVETVSVNALWVTNAKQPEELVYGVTKAIWNKNSRALMDAGHAKGKLIQMKTALDGVGIPLHPGAEKFYKEVGLLK